MVKPALLALADGSLFHGQSIGSAGEVTGEVVFNTSMTGYQEILTDPSYSQQIVTLTYPHIGNVGTNVEDDESDKIFAAGLVIRDLPAVASNWRSQQSLDAYLQQKGVIAIAGIDTRRLTRILREKGAQNACLMAMTNIDEEYALQKAREFPGLLGMDLAKVVSTRASYSWNEGVWDLKHGYQKFAEANTDANNQQAPEFHVVAFDFGIKRNILRLLRQRNCHLTVVPAQTSAEEVMNLKPDGVFLSNGPGDPEPCDYAIKAIQQIIALDIPIFGICLGHQLLALACGAKTEKMKFGHHGANHPVLDLATQQVLITSQNHGFAVSESTLPDHIRATHRSLFDGSLQGIEHCSKPAFSFQGHPEASPGPHDIGGLFDRFVTMMQTSKSKIC